MKISRNPFKSDLLFTSGMKGEEIHGEVAGFDNRNLNKSVTQPKSGDDDKAHEQCGDAGNREAKRLIAANILRGT